jgi:RNA polymerase sigma factor (sigma-70 family)
MTEARLAPVLRHIRKLAAPAGGEPSDARLLEQFAAGRDPDAFSALVGRHGPLVWRVCRRLLDRADLAEDAFQATWVVFARRAGAIRKPASLASWLHGVAFRVAGEVRSRLARQEAGTAPDRAGTAPDPGQEAAWRELGRIVEEEVAALPEPLRAPVLLCYWQGLTNDEAARRLGWAAGTLKARLVRAREVLHRRLTARGVALPAGVVAVLLAPAGAAGATVPAALAAATARAALGSAGAGGASGAAAALASRVLRAPLANGLRLTGAVTLVLAVLAAGAGVLTGPEPAGSPAGAAPAARAAAAPQKRRPAAPRPAIGAPADDRRAGQALTAGLRWLVKQQAADGHWSFGRTLDSDAAATALALLPLLRTGEGPPGAALFNPYAAPAECGLAYLARAQRADGGFPGGMRMYAQALATIALCQGYRQTADPRLRRPAQRGLDFIVAAQHLAGGWRYDPGQVGDTSVTSWQVVALDAGRSAGLRVPRQALAKASAFLDSVSSEDGSAYGYVMAGRGSPTMQAAGLFCRLRLGWGPRRPGVVKGVVALRQLSPQGGSDLYFLYHATRLMREVGGEDWRAWEPVTRRWLVTKQDGGQGGDADRGSWSPTGQVYAAAGGRLLVTTLALLTLEDCAPPARSKASAPGVLADKELAAFQAELGSDDFPKARAAMRALAAAPGQSVPALAEILRPPPKAKRERAARLIADLDAREFAVRDRATRELRKLGIAAEVALRRALNGTPSVELRQRVQRLLDDLEENRLGPGDLAALRAVEVLACAGTAEARRLLESLAHGEPEAHLTQEARAALRRLAGRAAAAP